MYICFLVFLAFLIFMEYFFKANNYDKIPYWKTRAIFITVITMSSAQMFSMWWGQVIPDLSVLNVSNYLPDPIAGLIGFMWATLAVYWWHRAMHRYGFLWKTFHQLHHSPHRLELLATFYTHPFNAISVTFFGSIMVHMIGLNFDAIAWYGVIYSMVSVFNHANINAPRWLGYIVQTPNMHRVHHQYNVHENNYSEFPLWDMLFGTYRNPGGNPTRCGFSKERELRFFSMLFLKDVHKE